MKTIGNIILVIATLSMFLSGLAVVLLVGYGMFFANTDIGTTWMIMLWVYKAFYIALVSATVSFITFKIIDPI